MNTHNARFALLGVRSAAAKGRWGQRFFQKPATFAYLMFLPAFIVYAIFGLYPMFIGLYVSLTDWNGFSAAQWVGWSNYRYAFQDGVFRHALWNNVLYSIVVTVVKTLLGLILAVQLNGYLRGTEVFRTIVFLPVTLSFVVVGILWTWLLNPNFGLINPLLEAVGLGGLVHRWLSDPDIAIWTIMGVDIWKWTGMHMVLILAGLQGISQDYYEAASIDGASGWQKFRDITLPLLIPVLNVVILLSLMGAWVRNYEVVKVMTDGGPGTASEVGLTWMIKNAFSFAKLGYASAMGYILAFIVLIFSVIQMKLLGSRDVSG